MTKNCLKWPFLTILCFSNVNFERISNIYRIKSMQISLPNLERPLIGRSRYPGLWLDGTKFAPHLLRCGLVARWRHYTRGYWGLHGKILHSGRTVSNICDYNNCQAVVWIKNLYLQANEKIKSMRGEAIICSNAHWLVDRRLANNSTAQWCHCIVYDVTHTEPGINAGSRLSWPLTTANRRSLGILAFPLVRAVLL